MSGRVVHFEIPYEDGGRARSFYSQIFGWHMTEMPGEEYALAITGPTGEQGPPSEPGFINGGMLPRHEPHHAPTVVVDVDDIDAAHAKIEGLGGSTVIGKQPVGEMGFAAYFRDPEGNLVGLWETAR
jgi:predicted enzyme related to lactoylglutathione lyase